MAIALDVSNRTGFTSTSTSQTTSHTCTGTNLLLYAFVATVGSGDQVTGVTYNSVAMTRLTIDFFATVGVEMYVYTLVAPSTGTHNVVVSFGGTQTISTTTISYTGAKQSAPTLFAAQHTAAATTWAQSLTTTADNSWVTAYLAESVGRAITAGANTVARQDGAGQGDHLVDSNSAKTPAGSDTLNISSFLGASTAVDSIMIATEPFASTNSLRTLMGIGI